MSRRKRPLDAPDDGVKDSKKATTRHAPASTSTELEASRGNEAQVIVVFPRARAPRSFSRSLRKIPPSFPLCTPRHLSGTCRRQRRAQVRCAQARDRHTNAENPTTISKDVVHKPQDDDEGEGSGAGLQRQGARGHGRDAQGEVECGDDDEGEAVHVTDTKGRTVRRVGLQSGELHLREIISALAEGGFPFDDMDDVDRLLAEKHNRSEESLERRFGRALNHVQRLRLCKELRDRGPSVPSSLPPACACIEYLCAGVFPCVSGVV